MLSVTSYRKEFCENEMGCDCSCGDSDDLAILVARMESLHAASLAPDFYHSSPSLFAPNPGTCELQVQGSSHERDLRARQRGSRRRNHSACLKATYLNAFAAMTPKKLLPRHRWGQQPKRRASAQRPLPARGKACTMKTTTAAKRAAEYATFLPQEAADIAHALAKLKLRMGEYDSQVKKRRRGRSSSSDSLGHDSASLSPSRDCGASRGE